VNIGILGGTFDPIHIGHLVMAEEARIKLRLDEMLFIPAGQPWLKQDNDITPASYRVEMVRRAIATNPYFKLCTIEVEHAGPSYAVDTLRVLHEQSGRGVDLFFIIGRDALADLPLWKEPNELIQLCHLVLAPRSSSRDLKTLEAAMPGLLDKVIQLDAPVIEVSSSLVRQRVASGLSIRYLVTAEVEDYIVEQKLYSITER